MGSDWVCGVSPGSAGRAPPTRAPPPPPALRFRAWESSTWELVALCTESRTQRPTPVQILNQNKGFGFRVQGSCTLHARSAATTCVTLSGFRFRVLDFGSRVSGFGFQVSGFRFRVSDFGFRISVFGFRVSIFGFRGDRRLISKSMSSTPSAAICTGVPRS